MTFQLTQFFIWPVPFVIFIRSPASRSLISISLFMCFFHVTANVSPFPFTSGCHSNIRLAIMFDPFCIHGHPIVIFCFHGFYLSTNLLSFAFIFFPVLINSLSVIYYYSIVMCLKMYFSYNLYMCISFLRYFLKLCACACNCVYSFPFSWLIRLFNNVLRYFLLSYILSVYFSRVYISCYH